MNGKQLFTLAFFMKTIFPVDIVQTKGDVINAEGLLYKKTLQARDYCPEATVFNGKSEVLLDFGKEICGTLRLVGECASCIGTNVRITFGESVSEALSEVESSTATNDHSPRDFQARFTMLSDVRYGQTGFRFVRIRFMEEGEQHRLIAAVAESSYFEKEQVGAFSCGDALVEKIYKTAAYTATLCLQNDMLWDGIKRDRLVWMGDVNPELRTLYNLYPNIPNIKNSLLFMQEATPKGAWINSIPAYSMWWIINIYDYYLYTRDLSVIRKTARDIQDILKRINESFTEDGDILFTGASDEGMAFYLDWPTYGDPEAKVGVIALCKLAMRAAEKLLRLVKRGTALAASIYKRLPRCTARKFKQVVAMCMLVGDMSAEEGLPLLQAGGAEGFSTFQSYYILKAMARAGDRKGALSCAKEYFGAMLSLGATTFWEDFDMAWAQNACRIDRLPEEGKHDVHAEYGKHCYVGYRHSLCHGWAAGVLAFIAEELLGVEILEAGGKTVRITPNLCGLQFMRGTVPTRYGEIIVRAWMEGETQRVSVTAPDRVTVLYE